MNQSKLRPYLILLSLCVFLSCKDNPTVGKESEVFDEPADSVVEKESLINKKDLIPLDTSDFLSGYLLIGQSQAFKVNQIENLDIKGFGAFDINEQGLITKNWSISNNFNEFFYDSKGRIHFTKFNQHSPPMTYGTEKHDYSKKGKLIKLVQTKYDKDSKEETIEVIDNDSILRNRKQPFQRSSIVEPYQIDTVNRIILNYRNDLAFCCGEQMPGKNQLLYYYNTNGLIDSLVIDGLESKKQRKYEYVYTPDISCGIAFTTTQARADSLAKFHKKIKNTVGNERNLYEEKFFCSFPDSFEGMLDILEYDSDTGLHISILLARWEKTGETPPIDLVHPWVTTFSNLQSVQLRKYYEKYFNMTKDGSWGADHIRNGFQIYERFESDTKAICVELAKHDNKTIKSIFRFILDGPHPENEFNQDILNRIAPMIERENTRLARLLQEAYAELIEDRRH